MTDGNEVRDGLYYSKTHEWVLICGENAKIGMTDYAQEQMSELVYAELPVIGKKYQQGDLFGQVESIKTVAAVSCPVDCEVLEINSEILNDPLIINQSPYDKGWFAIVKLDNCDISGLLNPEEYKKLIGA